MFHTCLPPSGRAAFKTLKRLRETETDSSTMFTLSQILPVEKIKITPLQGGPFSLLFGFSGEIYLSTNIQPLKLKSVIFFHHSMNSS